MKEWIKDIAIAVIVGVLILQFVKPTIVKEHSMRPTLNENNYIFLSKQAYRFHEPERGDIIVFHTDLLQANGQEKLLIKRIIGIPGDEISIKDGVVYRNGEALEEPYTMEGYTATDMEEIQVPDDKVFVMGDNRQNSIDSRDSSVGMIGENLIVGKAVFRLYPFDEIGLLANK
ncbi:MAG: signal peptidase I [Eubacteriales bacterium]|nr:signal peptidase I [Eubacteriales bacterium]MDD4583344.1 signal peptidase I [Eubacteriales bacterium]